MKKPTKKKHLKSIILLVLIIIAALAIGFFSGDYYADHHNTSLPSSSKLTHPICECPFIPANASSADIKRICPCVQ